MSIEAAFEEIYASGDEAATVLYALELTHPGIDGAVRWVMGVGEPVDDGEALVPLPIVPGQPKVNHTPCSFEIIRPGAEKNGPTPGRLRILGISGEAYRLLKGALGYDAPIDVVLREYAVHSSVAALTGPGATVDDLELTAVDLDGGAAEGALEFPDGRNLNVPTGPHAFFDRFDYRTLFA
ncbi:DUF1833 family protein [Enterovirga rhinocerotis]|uniref:Uncharacterized protein DUF1833 n=1 Tax=Enterovirga rhinocerotis TaxID=1339210 RepID=A0A4V3DYW5_9HYPH|nr:DUF1833 family protein [Enterovirga rhinocerotis]TDR94209.1 uncharacterized protein DUF1833 [Enterovirga rhinocerotis]